MSLVSVIIPTFNRAWIIKEAIKSVLNQDYKPLEIIVINDGSTDNTKDVLKPFMDKIVLLEQPNKGVSSARNLGIKTSKGKFIAFLDSDDAWTPEKISCQVNFFNNNPDVFICQTDEIWIRNGKRVNPKKKHKKISGMIFEPSLKLCLVSPSAVMMKRCFFDTKGLFDESLPACEDYDLWLRTAIDIPIYLIDKPYTIKKGGHNDQLSSAHSLDKYRILSIKKLLESKQLSKSQQNMAKKVLYDKSNIYIQGCIKRGKIQEARDIEAYLNIH